MLTGSRVTFDRRAGDNLPDPSPLNGSWTGGQVTACLGLARAVFVMIYLTPEMSPSGAGLLMLEP